MFQASVLNKYLEDLDLKKVEEAYVKFTAHFHNSDIQENIRNAKEEQYQEGFLRDLFVKVLGYTLNPDNNFNLTTELKNIKDGKKADGGILFDNKVSTVIELKGTDTTDLSKIENQAFGYKNNQEGCRYVVISNFEKLRFYIDNAIEHIEFNLFNLELEAFKLLWLCLEKNNLENNLPSKIKEESLTNEETVTKQLYKDYKAFRNELFNDILEKNLQHDKLTLFKKTQKLLDRFLFIFFAEDRNLVPPNSIREIIKHWETTSAFGEDKPLYDIFKTYFNVLNKGRESKGEREAIFAYNGGLFKPDAILDSLTIDCQLLHDHTQKISDYDFDSEVSVNILGHIFENSLNEIDEIKNELQGIQTDKKDTKRKKDGVFYTPKYITKYIVDNTIGKLCEDKKKELELREEQYISDKKIQAKTKKELLAKLNTYKDWLLQITICDPACGSGAFLNEALEFLIAEHHYIQELETKVNKGQISLFQIESHILENNLYGVDINDESVEIAKLSLWLRTAEKGRKLTDLSNNIKCGNSLIDDPEIAGDKAFNWQKEFPKVFGDANNPKGYLHKGFDCIIGNPPYVQLQSIKVVSEQLKTLDYKTYEATGDLYCLFYEKGFDILRPHGVLGFITSNKWMRAGYGKSLRNFFINNTKTYDLMDLGSGIFDSATVDSNIICFEKSKIDSQNIKALDLSKEKTFSDFSVYNHQSVTISPKADESWTIASKAEQSLKQKVEKIGTPLKDWDININYGIKTGYNDAFIIDTATKDRLIAEDPKSAEILKPILRGRDIKRYTAEFAGLWLIATFPALKINIDEYPAIKKYLEGFGKKLDQTGETFIDEQGNKQKSRKKTTNKWFETQDTIAYHQEFEKEKILYPVMCQENSFFFDKESNFCNDKAFIISGNNLKFLLTILNNKLVYTLIKNQASPLGDSAFEYRKIYLEKIPIPKIPELEQVPFVEKADQMLILNKDLQELNQKFIRTLQGEFEGLDKLTKNLENWYLLDYSGFIKELSKKKIKLSLEQKSEWTDYFENQKQKAMELKTTIDQTDKAIDQMVYDLYGLTDEEIKIVEENS